MQSVYDRLNQLASELVGDNTSPNVFFVTQEGRVLTATLDRRTAYLAWRLLAAQRPRVECALEDREHGMVCRIERGDGAYWQLDDDYARLTGDTGLESWEASQLIDYARSEQRG